MCAGKVYNQYLAEAEQLYFWPSNTLLKGTFMFTYSTKFVAVLL